MKILFAGSPDFVFPVLENLLAHDDVAALLTNAPSQTGRGKKRARAPLARAIEAYTRLHTAPSAPECPASDSDAPVPAAALAEKFARLKIIEAEKIDAAVIDEVRALHCDLLVCYAFGKLFTEEFLSLFKYGGINIHPSLLPRWRGATPVPSAILHGDTITGITIQTITKKMDAGKILASTKYPMTGNENTGELLATLTEKSIPLLRSVLADFPTALQHARTQDETEATYCSKRAREKIEWAKSAAEIKRTVLALTPNPKAFGYVAGERITLTDVDAVDTAALSELAARLPEEAKSLLEKKPKIGTILCADKQHGILVQTASGILAIKRLQREGKKEMAWQDFLNGYKGFLDKCFE